MSSPATDAQTDYNFPHPTGWDVQHVQYVAINARSIQGTAKDCKTCHDSLHVPAPVLKVSCGGSCHTQSSGNPNFGPTTPGPTQSTTPPPVIANNECISCHADHANRPNWHFPAGAGLCRACHGVQAGHLATPHVAGTATTEKSEAKTCYACHERMDNHSVIHPALQFDNACLNCHDPHGSNFRKSLRQNIENTCATCHTMLPEHSGSIHGVIKSEASCLNCHNPHSSNNAKLLVMPSQDLCLSCHNQEIQTAVSADPRVLGNISHQINELPFVHSGAAGGDTCLTCHNPHASATKRLTAYNYPSDRIGGLYQAGNCGPGSPSGVDCDKVPAPAKPLQNNYALCFQCHDAGMLAKDISKGDTGFRNDTTVGGKTVRENLHWWHVVNAGGGQFKDQGRSCYACHEPHGASQPHNIKTKFRMSATFDVTVEYSATATGGQCTKSCHDLKAYKRLD